MTPEIHEYYKYLLGEVDVPPGPIVLPDGFSATALAKIIHQTLVKKASMLENAQHVQILYSAWAILNDSYIPVRSLVASTQTDQPAGRPCLDSFTQTLSHGAALDGSARAPLRTSGTQTAVPPSRDGVCQTDGRAACTESAVQTDSAPCAASAAVQTEAVRMRNKWTQMRRRTMTVTGSQTDRPPSPPPPPPPGLEVETQTVPPPPGRMAETQTMAPPACRTSETQTLLAQALPGRRAVGTQTAPSRPPWVVRLVRGALPPPPERPPEPRSFHGRRLLRRGTVTTPPEIPLTATAAAPGAAGDGGSPTAAAPTDPRLMASGSESSLRTGRRRVRAESDTGSIASPTGHSIQSGRRSRSGSSGGEADPPCPAPAPPHVPCPVTLHAPGLDSAAPVPTVGILRVRTAEELGLEPPVRPALTDRLRSLDADDQKVPLSLNSNLANLTAMLDTSHSFLSAPPPELELSHSLLTAPPPPPELSGDGDAMLRPDASAARRRIANHSGSDMDLTD